MLNKIKQYFALRKARKRFILLGKMIDALDRGFTKNNLSRQQRRRFWFDFIRSPEYRKKFMEEMKL